MTEIRPVDLPEKDLPLRADVSLLGSLVGQMLVEQHVPRLLQLVETILATLDKPDPEISAAWAAEAEDRLAAYRRGELEVVDESEVFGDLDRAGRFALSRSVISTACRVTGASACWSYGSVGKSALDVRRQSR